MSGFEVVQAVGLVPSNAGLRALEVDHEALEAAGPRQTRQVPRMTLVVCCGSRSVGASSRLASWLTWASPMVAGGMKLEAVQLEPRVHCARLMPAPMASSQLVGVLASSDGKPPSPDESCGQEVSDEADVVAVEPMLPRPARRVLGSVGCCAKPTTSAREPIVVLRLSKWVLSLGSQTEPVSATPSSERHRPPSLPTKSRGPVVDSLRAAMACWLEATFAGALQPLRALVVLRRVQAVEFAAMVQR